MNMEDGWGLLMNLSCVPEATHDLAFASYNCFDLIRDALPKLSAMEDCEA